jgi:hypothetical protein
MKKFTKDATYWFGVVAIGLVFGLTIQFVTAWTEPTVAPPGGNVGAPVNTGDTGQIKGGSMILNSLGAYLTGLTVNGNLSILNGKVSSLSTAAADPGTTLVTKDYVDAAGGGASWLFLTNYAECGSSTCDAIAGVDCGAHGMVVAGYYGRAEKRMDIDGDPITWWHVMNIGAISNELPSDGHSISCTSPVVLGTTQKVSCTMRNGDSSWSAFSGVAVICSK